MPRTLDQPQPPDATYIRQRHIPQYRVDWAMACDEVMMEYGEVQGSQLYPKHHQARQQARSLIHLLERLHVHERWQMIEHVDRQTDGGWRWRVEYVRRREDAGSQKPGGGISGHTRSPASRYAVND